ncbi:hypothetical protein BDV29DRAFT_165137 [Aspergillus leporis]|jgi:hypothetical protein|uniref:Uncharacterized protein n=1 Tax=Aspergillus leporis TaxID=41062 RepID=A0A5N5XER8_9EURO|nr:hypothetical protein BDV29DRAFT_165137 [Aspergillus leporis]
MERKDLSRKEMIWESDCRSCYKDANTGKVSGPWPRGGLSYIDAMAVQRFEDFDAIYATKNCFLIWETVLAKRTSAPKVLFIMCGTKTKEESVFPKLMSTDNVKDAANSLIAKEATQEATQSSL